LAYSRRFTITTTRQLIIPIDGSAQEVHIHSESGTVYVGGSDVTSSNGFKLDNNEKLTLTIHPGDEIYAITSAGTNVVMILVLVR
jgi:hypothetical protein